MPLINVKVIEGVFTPKQKQDMIAKITDAMVAIEGENLRPMTLVTIEEIESGNLGVGGNVYTTNDVKEIAAAKIRAAA
jgi:4-oxalocrotonate tautomerase